MSGATCWNCRFFDQSEEGPEADEGACRRYPPTVCSDIEGPQGFSPIMDAMSWCGEFVRKEEQ